MKKAKKFVKRVSIISILVLVAYLAYDTANKAHYINVHGTVASSTTSLFQAVTPKEPTRLERTQQLIEALTEERKNDPTFKAETYKMQIALDKHIAEMKEALIKERNAQAKIDALFVIKTQYEAEISTLDTSSKK